MNAVFVVGKIKNIEILNNEPFQEFFLEIERNFQDSDGNYTSDILKVKTWNGMLKQINEIYKLNDIVSIKGRLEETNDHTAIIIAENIELVTKRN